MPIIAIGAAVFAVAAAVATDFAIFATIAAVGATIGAVGAVTNNKALMIAGGVIGAIGGVGALAQSAGIIGSDASLFGSVFGSSGGAAASAAPSIESEIAQWSQYGADLDVQGNAALSGVGAYSSEGVPLTGTQALEGVPTTASQTVDPTTGAVQSLDTSVSPQISAASGPDVTPTGTVDNGVIPQGDSGAINAPGDVARTAGADPNGSILNGVTPPAAPSAPSVGVDPQGNSVLANVTGKVATPTTESLINAGAGANNPAITINRVDLSAWDGIKDFIKDNNRLVAGVAQAGASFIAGATNGLTPAQIAALNAQADANQAATNLSRMQQANMSQPIPVASRVATPPVTGAPAGIINTAPPRPNMGAA